MVLVTPGLVEALQATSQRLAVDLAAKTQELDHLSHKLRTFEDDHAEEVQSNRFQVIEQDKVIKGLQEEVQQLRASLDWPRSHTGCQTQSPECADVQCQAVPSCTEASQQTQHLPGCSAASQTEAVPGLNGPQGDLQQQQQQQERAVASVSVDTQTDPPSDAISPGRQAAATKDAQKAASSQSPSNNQSAAFDLQVLTKKFERVVQQKIEADEAALQAHNDVSQLIKLCEFYKGKAESAVMAHMSLKQSLQCLSPQGSQGSSPQGSQHQQQGAPHNGPQGLLAPTQSPNPSPASQQSAPHHNHLHVHQQDNASKQHQGPPHASPALEQNGWLQRDHGMPHQGAPQPLPHQTQTATTQHCHSIPKAGDPHQQGQQGGVPVSEATGHEVVLGSNHQQQAGVQASHPGSSSACPGAGPHPPANGLS